MTEHVQLAIVGSGPGGLSAAVTAARLGVSHVLFERSDHLADTIYKYQKGKKVMAHPMRLPLLGDVPFDEGKREDILAGWAEATRRAGAAVRYNAEINRITRQDGKFALSAAGGETVTAEAVVLAIGLQGNLRRLEIPGADNPMVQYQLDDPDAFVNQRIVVIGAGDAGIENALALCGQNEVSIINRQPDFSKAKPGNAADAERAVRAGRLTAYHQSNPARIEDGVLVVDTPKGERAVPVDLIIARLGAIPPRKFIESCGIVFPSRDPAAIPELSETYQSNVPGLYIIGALGGYTLIKQAINQGHELVCRLAGQPCPPADEGILRDRFESAFPGAAPAEVLAYLRQNVPMLAGLTTLQLREAMLDCTLQRFPAGATVFRRGDYTNSLWAIAEGAALVQLDAAHPESGIRLGAGEFFGELGLVAGRRRTATIAAAEPSVMVEIPVRAMRRLMSAVDAVQRELDRVTVRRLVHTTLGPGRPISELEDIIAAASLRRVKAMQKIVGAGDAVDALYILRSGSATVSRFEDGRATTVGFISAGGLFGERGFLDPSATRAATVTATVASEVVSIDAAAVRAALARAPALRQVFTQAVQTQLDRSLRATVASAAQPAANDATAITDFLIAKGAGEATNLFVIDESICTRCGNCESACAATHGGISRVSRDRGTSAHAILLPLACRHCETPHCMGNCPVDAISRTASGEVIINQETCIGCYNCANDCPYDVISMVDVGAGKAANPNWLTWLLEGVGLARPAEPDHHGSGNKKAMKCDLCRGTGGVPACVTACPTGAAARVEPEVYMNFLREGRIKA